MISEAILKEFYAIEAMGAKPIKLLMGAGIYKALTGEMCDDAGIPSETCALTMFRGVQVEKGNVLGPDNFSVMWHK